MASKTLLLCFRLDGPYWDDLIYLSAYPSGFTYEKWPFRYRDVRMHSEILAQMPAWDRVGSRLEVDAILAARFMSVNYLNWVLPIRKIKITRASAESGTNSFYFRLMEPRDFSSVSDLQQGRMQLPAEEWSSEVDSNPLALYSSLDFSSLSWAAAKTEGDSWAKLVDLVGASENVPMHAELKSATFVRFSAPSRGSAVCPIEALFTDDVRGSVFGASMKEGRAYTIKVTHRITGKREETRPTLSLEYKIANHNIELSQPVTEVIGYQQTTPMVVSALSATPAWEDFVVRASRDGTATDAAPAEARVDVVEGPRTKTPLFSIPIPLKVRPNWLYRMRSRWIWSILLFLALTVQGAATLLKEFFSKFFEGKADLSSLLDYWPVWLIVLVTSSAASFAITAMNGKNKVE